MLHHEYDPVLVLTSILIAWLAGYAALDLSARVALAAGWERARWTAASALAMGVGIWSMHFIAMLALRIDVPVFYDIPLLAVSIAIAISASAFTFMGAAAERAGTGRLALASLAMGPAIAGMHYTGMAAMRMPARIEYHDGLVALSVVIAVTASFAALLLARYFRAPVRGAVMAKIVASGLMGAAVYGMHYTGMMAARFVRQPGPPATPSDVLATDGLAWAIAAGALVVMALTVLAGIADRRLVAARSAADEAVHERARVIEALHRVGQSLASELDLERIVQAVTDAGTSLTGAQFGAFFYNQLGEPGEAYTLYTISGVPREAFSRFPMPRNTPVFAPTFYGEGVVRSDDITQDPRYGTVPPHFGMPEGHLPVRSYLAVPVISRGGAVLGGLFFGHERAGVFEQAHEQLAEGVASWAAVAMDNAILFEAEQRARVEAERANRAKSDFLTVMSHELRTPLNAIVGYSDLLLAGIPDPITTPVRSKVERIVFSANHLLQLIEEILTFSRLEADEERVDAQIVDAAGLLDEVHALMEPLALKKEVSLLRESSEESISLRSDPRKIRQILINLITNGIKFTDVGSVVVRLESRGDQVVFRVCDTGRGIAPEHRERVFEPFWQVEAGPARGADGAGLGLAVSRRLARLLGGDLVLDPTWAPGSCFELRLPVGRAAVVAGGGVPAAT